ncbi:MAG: T9SS type A sorting domain-containing protein [Ignavibacteria bacterium]|nr:T9SS type A sorting domain-containing protein [Ignavibacteria bacterium]MCC7158311.1 T9SS type A sorting domain-containing protein [Ignavibacteria bacterium]
MKSKLLQLFVILFVAFQTITFSQSWVQISTVPSPIFDINSISVVDANTIWVCGTSAHVRRSTNGGFNWTNVSSGLAGDLYGICAIDANTCWIGTVAGSIYKTTNGGTNWVLQHSLAGSFSNGVQMFDANNGVFYGDPTGSGQPYQFRTTTNGGTNWVLAPGAPIAGNEFGVINAWDWTSNTTFWIGSANLAASAPNAKVYYTTTGFTGTWNSATVAGSGGAQGLYYQAVGFINATSGMVGSNGSNLMRTTNGGVNWVAASIPSGIVSFAAINLNGMKDGSNVIRAVINEGVGYRMFRTSNLGVSWTEETVPVTTGIAHLRFLSASLGFAGCAGGAFLRYGPPVGIDPGNTTIPESFNLGQNYPNPFNPSTSFKYTIPTSGMVTLKIYDNVGSEIMTLVDRNMSAGNYIETVDMSAYSSGIYFYTLTAGSFVETKKMILVK